jgi:hypothetical protein
MMTFDTVGHFLLFHVHNNRRIVRACIHHHGTPACQHDESLRESYAYFYHILATKSPTMIGSSSNLIQAPFDSKEGVQQGCVFASFGYCLGANDANNKTLAVIQSRCPDGALLASMDDTYLVGPPEVIFPHAIPAHENNLRELVGLDFQPLKSACYINSTFHTNAFHNLHGSIPEQQLTLDDGSITRGLTIYGAPLGDTAFIKQYLQNHKVTLDHDFVAISDLLCPG